MRKLGSGRSAAPAMAACVTIGLILTGLFAVLASRFLGSVGWPALIGLVAGAIALVVAFSIPAHWLPAIALVAFSVVPNRITPTGYTLRIPLWGVLIGVWVLRRLLDRSRPVGQRTNAAWRSLTLGWRVLVYGSAVAFLGWAVLASVRSEFSRTSLAWVASIVVCVLLPLLVLDAKAEARLLRSAWIIGAGVAGAYAVLELILQGSPVYGTLYDLIGVGDVQHWILYRAEASFGHPLMAGTYFATAAVLGIASWLDNHRGRDLVCGGIAAAATVATVSRSSMLALAVGLSFALVAWTLAHADRPVGKPVVFGFLGLVAAIGVLNSAPVAARSTSLESVRSAGARDTALTVAMKGAASTDWLGSGPGTSGITGRLFDDVTIESSVLQLLLSVGIPGLLLFALFLVGLGLTAWSARDIAAAAALLAFTICIVGYNAIDGVRATHLLLGFMVMICMNPVDVHRSSRSEATFRPRQPVRARGSLPLNPGASP